MLTILVLIPILAAVLTGFCKLPARPTALAAVTLNILLGAIVMTAGGDAWPVLNKLNVLQLTMANGIQQVMLLLTLIVSFAAVIGTKAPEDAQGMWYNSTLLISAGALGAFLSDSLIGFFSFHELALIPTFLMIGIYGRGSNKRTVAWRATLYLGLGSLVLLAGLVMLMNQAHCYTFSELAAAVSSGALKNISSCTIPALFLVGFGPLISLFPFHSWAAPAYAAAPAPIAMMHAGVLKKFGLYGLFMLASVLPEGYFSAWNPVLLVLLLGNVLWVGWVTINQKRLDLTLGNSSVMHMGYIFLAFAAYVASTGGMNDIAFKGGILLMLGHGLSIALLFLLCGSIERSTGSLEYATLGGLGAKMPTLAFLFGMGAMASIGLPGFANFPGEIMVFFSGFKGWFNGTASLGALQITTICCLWGLVISAVYMLRAYRNVFQGPTTRMAEGAKPMEMQERLAAIILCFALLAIGLYPNLILNILQ